MIVDAVGDRKVVMKEPFLRDFGEAPPDPSSRGDVGALLFDGHRSILVDVTVRTPSMTWADTDSFLSDAEKAKERKYYAWLRKVSGRVSVFYAAMSVHGRRGEGFDDLIQFCAKLRAERCTDLEARSLRAVFQQAWRARFSLAAVRMAYDHSSRAVATLLKGTRLRRALRPTRFSRFLDVVTVAGATDLRIPPSSQVGGESMA